MPKPSGAQVLRIIMQFFLIITVLLSILATGANATESPPPECKHLKIQFQQADVFRKMLVTNLAATRELMTLAKANESGCLHRTITATDDDVWRKQQFYDTWVHNGHPVIGMSDDDICDIHRNFYVWQNEHMFRMANVFEGVTNALRNEENMLREICQSTGEEGKEMLAMRHAFMESAFATIGDFDQLKASFTDGCDASEMTGVGSCSGGAEYNIVEGQAVLC